MTSDEYQKLVNNHGEEATKQMIDILDNYKGGIMSIDMVQMQTALSADQSVIKETEDGKFDFDYSDNTNMIDAEYEHITQPEMTEAEKEYALFQEKQGSENK